jgi:hypothetical protein
MYSICESESDYFSKPPAKLKNQKLYESTGRYIAKLPAKFKLPIAQRAERNCAQQKGFVSASPSDPRHLYD